MKLPIPIHQHTMNRLNFGHGGHIMKETPLEKAHRINKSKRDAGVTISKEYNLMKKAMANPKSKKMAIAGNCFHCFGGIIDSMPDPGWQQLIRSCTDHRCPLYLHRPYTKTKRPIAVGDVPKNAKLRQ